MKKSDSYITPDRKESVAHGDVFLPVNSYHCLIPDTYTELSLHWHEEMEVTLIREGTSNYKVGQMTFQAEAGEIIIVPPFTLHSAVEIPGQTMISDSLVFHPDFLGASGPDLAASKYLRPLAMGQLCVPEKISPSDAGYTEILGGFLTALECFMEKPSFYELKLKEHLFHLVVLLFSSGHVSQPVSENSEWEKRKQLKAVLQYIGEHYQEHISVASLASLSGFSESYFMSFFKQNAGMSCIHYINHYRMQKAADALETTDLPVMEIALDHGYKNISYFNLMFKRQFGVTPGEFRKRGNAGNVGTVLV